MKNTRLFSLGVVALIAQACATTRPYTATEEEPQEPAARIRYGRVQTIREEVRRMDSEPAEDALSGAFIGASIGAYRPTMHFGAAGSTILGAFATDDRSEARRYEVTVRFDDGSFQTFYYDGYSPFQPGQQVMLTPKGLFRN